MKFRKAGLAAITAVLFFSVSVSAMALEPAHPVTPGGGAGIGGGGSLQDLYCVLYGC